MPALRTALARTSAAKCYAVATTTPGRIWQVKPTLGVQRAGYAVPPLDKRDDDLGGPYGQESPDPDQRKKQNRGFAGQAAIAIGGGLGIIAIFSGFASPRQIAKYQIDNDTVIGGPNSNTGASLAKVKHKEGVKSPHELHHEQTGSTVLGTK